MCADMITDTFEAPDGCRLRWGIWRGKRDFGRGTVLLLHGRTEYLEKYEETAWDLNRRGFDVLSLDWRGQGRSCRLLADPEKGHVDSYDDYLGDLEALIAKMAPRLRAQTVGVLAHSMGGHIALRYLSERTGRFRWAVLVSPMVNLCWNPVADRLLRAFTRAAVVLGGSGALAPGGRHVDQARGRFEGNRLSSDRTRFEEDRKGIKANPDLAVGGVTFGWLSATFQSIDTLNGKGYTDRIRTPVVIVGAGQERVVSLQAQQRICKRLSAGRFYLLPGARHEILRETDEVRERFWKIFDWFTG
jgi:lysophospholipase